MPDYRLYPNAVKIDDAVSAAHRRRSRGERMKLYFSPGACSFAPHIALREGKLPFEAVKVDLRKHTLADGTDYYAINPKGYVPVLELDDGTRLTEVAVILQYIADRNPGTLAPAFGNLDRYRLMEWLNFVATEIHKQFSPLWYPDTPESTKEAQRAKLAKRFDYLSGILGKQPYLAGEKFTIADAYLHAILNWSGLLKVDLSPWPALVQYQQRIAERPAVVETQKAEHAAPAPKTQAA
jgi:glutathione S-transferase